MKRISIALALLVAVALAAAAILYVQERPVGLATGTLPAPEKPLPPTPGDDPPAPTPTNDELAFLRELAAERAGTSAEAVLLDHVTPLRYSNLGLEGWALKVVTDDAVLSVHAIYEDGRLVPSEDLSKEDAAAWSGLHGPFSPELVAELAELSPGEPIDVDVWLADEDPSEPFDGLLPQLQAEIEEGEIGDPDAWSQALAEAAAERSVLVAEPVLTRLAELGIEPTTPALAPILRLEADAELLATIADWPEVASIDPVREPVLAMHSARRTIGAKTVNDRGVTGKYLNLRDLPRVRVAAVDPQGVFNLQNPYSGHVVAGRSLCTTGPSRFPSHLQMVVGTISSVDSHDRGVATEALVHADGSCGRAARSGSRQADRDAFAWGARILNHSWGTFGFGTMTGLDRYHDYLSFVMRASIFVSAGNNGDCWDGCDDDPRLEGWTVDGALAYNVITVGASDDHDTDISVDDTIAGFSSFRDPISSHHDREKPELVAPGTAIGSLDTDGGGFMGWKGIGWGTSFASPIAAGSAALLASREGPLAFQPEAIKALLLASSVVNVHGARPVSDRDGAGEIDLELADRIVRGIDGGYRDRWIDVGSNWGTVALEPIVVTQQQIDYGHPIRAALAWLVSPRPVGRPYEDVESVSRSYASTIPVDLDLLLLPPGKDLLRDRVALSIRFDNSYEVLEYMPTTPGTYQLVIHIPVTSTAINPGLFGVPVAWAWTTSL